MKGVPNTWELSSFRRLAEVRAVEPVFVTPAPPKTTVAARVGLTERRTHDIVNALAEAGYVVKAKDGAAQLLRDPRTPRRAR